MLYGWLICKVDNYIHNLVQSARSNSNYFTFFVHMCLFLLSSWSITGQELYLPFVFLFLPSPDVCDSEGTHAAQGRGERCQPLEILAGCVAAALVWNLRFLCSLCFLLLVLTPRRVGLFYTWAPMDSPCLLSGKGFRVPPGPAAGSQPCQRSTTSLFPAHTMLFPPNLAPQGDQQSRCLDIPVSRGGLGI